MKFPTDIPTDSKGTPIFAGDRVRWRGREYTIKAFGPPTGRFGTCVIEFEEPRHSTEDPDEISVDLIGRAG